MTSNQASIELVNSFKDCWQAFRTHYQKIVGDHPLSPEEETEFLRTKEALLERYRRIQATPLGASIPASLSASIEHLGRVQTVSALSDAQLESLKEAGGTAERDRYLLRH